MLVQKSLKYSSLLSACSVSYEHRVTRLSRALLPEIRDFSRFSLRQTLTVSLRCSENLTSSITCIYYVYIIIFINFIKSSVIVVTRPFGSLVQVLGSSLSVKPRSFSENNRGERRTVIHVMQSERLKNNFSDIWK